MIRKLFIFIAVGMGLNFFPFTAYSEEPVSFEMRFLCQEPSSGCDKMIDPSSSREVYVQKQVQFSLSDLKNARLEFQQNSYNSYGNEKSLMGGTDQPRAKIELVFTDEATRRLIKVTSDNVNKRLGIIFDGKLVMAPNIREPITSGTIEIVGLTVTTSFADDIVYRINKALGFQPPAPPSVNAPINVYVVVIAIMLGLIAGWGAIKVVSIAFPKIRSVICKDSLKDSAVFLITNTEIQKRLMVTIASVVMIYLASKVPVPGIDKSALQEFIDRMTYASGGMSALHMSIMQKLTIMRLGLGTFFTSCVLLQVISFLIPALKNLYFGKSRGRSTLSTHTYLLTIVLAICQSYFIALWIESSSTWGGMQIVASPGIGFQFLTVVTITAAVAVLLFIANLINRYGIGNGYGVIAVYFLLPNFLTAVEMIYWLIKSSKIEPMALLILTASFILVAYLAFCLTRYFDIAEIQDIQGKKVQLPLRASIVGKLPLTLAWAVFFFPLTVASFIHSHSLYHLFHQFGNNPIIYVVGMSILTVLLIYIYAVIIFDTKQIEGKVAKRGYSFTGNVQSVTGYLDNKMTKILIWTGCVLVTSLILKELVMFFLKTPLKVADLFGAAFLLIIVGVFSDIISQLEFFKEKSKSGIKEWAICHVAADEIEATIESNFLKSKNIPALVEPLRFTWGLPIRTMVDQYRIYVPYDKKDKAWELLKLV